MALIQAVHQRWAATGPLCALLPAARVSTGMSAGPAVPRAVILRRADRPLCAANDGSQVRSVELRIEIFHGSYDAALAIVEQVAAAFDRADFDLPSAGRVIQMRRTSGAEEETSDGVWCMTVDFTCDVHFFEKETSV